MSEKLIQKNREALFNYEIIDKFEAGISLLGWEVKSIRAGNANLKSSFCVFDKVGNLQLQGCHISQYMAVEGDELRDRQLLLNKSELKKLKDGQSIKGYAIIPLDLKWKNGYVKLDIALARGKNVHDKRVSIKERDLKRIEKTKF